MFRLLPNSERVAVRREYSFRKWTVFLLLLVATGFALILLLLPSYIILGFQVTELSTKATNSQAVGAEEMSANIQELNGLLDYLEPKSEQTDFLNLLEIVAQEIGPRIVLSKIGYTTTEKGVIVVSLSGVASSRQELVLFRDRLSALGVFEKVEVPLSNFAQEINVEFDMTLTMP